MKLVERYRRVRAFSKRICGALEPEDCVVQSMPDASPLRWHLAHTTWFFETFVLKPYLPSTDGYRPGTTGRTTGYSFGTAGATVPTSSSQYPPAQSSIALPPAGSAPSGYGSFQLPPNTASTPAQPIYR